MCIIIMLVCCILIKDFVEDNSGLCWRVEIVKLTGVCFLMFVTMVPKNKVHRTVSLCHRQKLLHWPHMTWIITPSLECQTKANVSPFCHKLKKNCRCLSTCGHLYIDYLSWVQQQLILWVSSRRSCSKLTDELLCCFRATPECCWSKDIAV